jgi:purine-nucleoside/S-methyl-5'-thioadenosine phosphorylase / adenosine deaminase
MEIHRRNGIKFYCFENLMSFPLLCHGITTRQGGVSQAPFDSLNMSRHVGETADPVDINRERVWSGFAPAKPVLLNQVHGHTVVVWDGTAHTVDHRLPVEADAIVTDQNGWLLTILVADCQSVLLYDPVSSVIANIHSGWRGSIADIIARTVAVMRMRFGCDPAHIHAGIGPSLGPCCAEFVNFRKEIPESLWSYRVSEKHFDFWAMSRDQLVRAGLCPEHIEISRICTRCRRELFFSYRAAHTTGRFAAIIGMNRWPEYQPIVERRS